jgi:Flp pilus assembly protein TadG
MGFGREFETRRANEGGAPQRVAQSASARGQAVVEFALIATVAMFVLLVGVQLALIGDVALSLGQVTYQAARYAAINASASQAAVQTYVKNIAPSTLLSNGGADLSVGVSPNTTRTFASPVTVTISYNTQSKVLLPNPFLGVSFPTSLSSAETALTE